LVPNARYAFLKISEPFKILMAKMTQTKNFKAEVFSSLSITKQHPSRVTQKLKFAEQKF